MAARMSVILNDGKTDTLSCLRKSIFEILTILNSALLKAFLIPDYHFWSY
jgi:hypothetical protein